MDAVMGIGLALHIYCNYEKFFLAGDFNVEEEEEFLDDFFYEHKAKYLVNQKHVSTV